MSDAVARINSLFREMCGELLPIFRQSTVTIYRPYKSSFTLNRNGTLFAIGDRHFVITASHGLREAISEHGIPLFMSNHEEGSNLIPLTDANFTLTERLVPDIAVIDLPTEVVDNLKTSSSRFLRLNDVDQRTSDPSGVYVIFGYPGKWLDADERHFSIDAIPFLTGPYKGELHADFPFEDWVHLSLDYDVNAINGLDGSWRELPAVNGMSGCAIWRIGDTASDVLDGSWRGRCRAIAVQHRWNADRRYVLGTWIRHAIGLIYHNYPGLRSCFDLHAQ